MRANDKKQARLAIISHLLERMAPAKIRKGIEPPDPAILFPFEPEALSDGRLAE